MNFLPLKIFLVLPLEDDNPNQSLLPLLFDGINDEISSTIEGNSSSEFNLILTGLLYELFLK